MKTSFVSIRSLMTFFILSFQLISLAQDFQRDYGTPLDNSFTKVINDGNDYYVLGQDEAINGNAHRATVTRLDANGFHLWTLSLNMASVWNDATLTPSGELMVVGSTLPFDASAKSLMGRVSRMGSFQWLRSYDEIGREAFNRIGKDPFSANYYVLGNQFEPGGTPTTEDAVLFKVDDNGNFIWKKIYVHAGDSEFFRDFEVLPNGNLILAGNDTRGLIFLADNSGTLLNGVQMDNRVFRDVAQNIAGGFYSVATFGPTESFVQKYDSDLLLMWEVKIPELTSISQIWEGNSGEIYVTGKGIFDAVSRAVIVKMTYNNGLTVNWVKYLKAGNGFIGGSSWKVSSTQLAFTDARTLPNGFGQSCAFISVSDLDLNTCEVETAMVSLINLNPLPEGPSLPGINFQDVPMGTNISNTSSLNWLEQTVCSNDPCDVSISTTLINDCGTVLFIANASGASPYSFQWCDGQNTPTVKEELLCGTHELCVTVTCADGSMASASTTYVVSDTIPPTAICSNNVSVALDANCMAVVMPGLIDAGSTDDCEISSLSVNPPVINGCGFHPVTLTVTDWCGNTSTCSTTVQASEMVPPVITNCPQNQTVNGVINPNGICVADLVIGSPVVSDLCSLPVSLVNDFNNSSNASGTYPEGPTMVTFTATDDCGNQAICSFSVTVICENDPSMFNCGQAVVTCFSGFINNNLTSGIDLNAPVFALVDLRDQSSAISGNYWQSASQNNISYAPGWNAANMGQVFGIATTPSNDIYVTSTTAYGCQPDFNPFGPAGASGVYKIDHVNGNVSNFVSTGAFVPNTPFIPTVANGGGLGNITYDIHHNQFFVTNHSDGMIYRIDANGNVTDRFDPQFLSHPTGCSFPSLPGFAPLGERLWGIGYHKKTRRLYFSRWVEDKGRICPGTKNQIFSIGIDQATGGFLSISCTGGTCIGGETLEIDLPDHIDTHNPTVSNNYSMPVSDIEFSESGLMLLGERSMSEDCGEPDDLAPNYWQFFAHQSRVLEYHLVGNTWTLTPGHGTPPFSNYATDLKFSIGFPGRDINGNLNTGGPNCVGGVDYGYQSFDPSKGPPVHCDSMVWSTGDALFCNPTGLGCTQFCLGQPATPLPNRIYGLQGNSSSGGDNCSGFLIDLDADICCYDKRRNGDIDILKCGCLASSELCDSISVTSMPFNGSQDTCCFKLTVDNQLPNFITAIELCSQNGVSFSSVSALNGWSLCSYTAGQVIVCPPNFPINTVPVGQNDFIKFCLSNYQTVPNQQVIVKYLGPGNQEVCRDTLNYQCSQKPKCLKTTAEVECGPNGTYLMDFCVMADSLIPFNVSSFQLNPPPGITFTPNVFTPNPSPLTPGQMQCNFMTTISGPAATDGSTFCFSVTAHEQNILLGENPLNCCTDTVMVVCITLPTCVCDKVWVDATSVNLPPNQCCQQITLHNNYSNNFFNGVELLSITNGVVFGAINNSSLAWNVTSNATQAIFKKLPLGTQLGPLETLPPFCLSGITSTAQVPQTIVVNWLDSNDQAVCSDTLTFECQPPSNTACAVVVNPKIICDPDLPGAYLFSFQVQNNSGFTINQVVLNNVTPPGSLLPNTISIPPLANGATSGVIATQVIPPSGITQFCFQLTVHEINSAGNELNCCTHTPKYCFTLPPCCECYHNLTLTSAGMDYPVFCDPQVGFIPALPCPADDVTISGFFGCADPGTAEPCEETEVLWELMYPDSTLQGGLTTNFTHFIFDTDEVDEPGLYCLNLMTICPSTMDTCICKVSWIQQECPDTCCTTLEAFCDRLDNNVTLSVNEDSCKATLNIGDIGCDSYIEWVDWNYPSQQNPVPNPPGSMVMHTYPGSGTYTICYLAVEFDSTGLVCFEKIVCDTITINCEGSIHPCDSLSTSITPPPNPTSLCCWDVTLNNAYSNNVSNVAINALSNIDLMSVSSSLFPNINHSGNTATVTGPSGIPIGSHSNAITICLDNITGVPQTFSVAWTFPNPANPAMDTTACEDIYVLDCNFNNTCECSSPGPELVFNGDFTLKGTGVFTHFRPGFPGGQASQTGGYSIVDSAQVVLANPNWVCSDHPSGDTSGLFMILDGPSLSEFGNGAWAQTIGVEPGREYEFCAFAKNLNPAASNLPEPIVQVFVNGVPITSSISIPESTGDWTSISGTWESGVNSIAFVEIHSISTEAMGNDLALDDISFKECIRDTCYAGPFSEMYFRITEESPGAFVECGQTVNLNCPEASKANFTGAFHCFGSACPEKPYVEWNLIDPMSNVIASGTSETSPYFGISLSPVYFQTSGIYELHLSGDCGSENRSCVIYFSVAACSDPCPCTTADIQDFEEAVSFGFANIKFEESCKACFSPVSLDDCVSVEWIINGTSTGSSSGNQPFCHEFPVAGNYIVTMQASRLNSDGTDCTNFSISQSVNVTCGVQGDCVNSIIPNHNFSEGIADGVLNDDFGGASEGWTSPLGNPLAFVDRNGILPDSATMTLFGNNDQSDVLGREGLDCLPQDSGMINLRLKPFCFVQLPIIPGYFSYMEEVDTELCIACLCKSLPKPCPPQIPVPPKPGLTLSARLYTENAMGVDLDDCVSDNCLELGPIQLPLTDHLNWLTIEVPYFKYRVWDPTGTGGCIPDPFPNVPGLEVRPTVFVSNWLGDNQLDSRSIVVVDEICVEPDFVDGVEHHSESKGFRLFPNPTTGELNLEFNNTSLKKGKLQIADLWGRNVRTETLTPDIQEYSFTMNRLPAGVYFVKVFEEDLLIWTEKIVKQ